MIERYCLGPKERDAVLAALRMLQSELERGGPGCLPDPIRDIFTCGEDHDGITAEHIDELCENLNT